MISANTLNSRSKTHYLISEKLDLWSDEKLQNFLLESNLIEQGHTVLELPDTSSSVFVKLLPISTFELLPQNRFVTANIFQLPIFYQYRIGSSGFGAWRELKTHQLSNEFVLSGDCENFPLLHHWRILSLVPEHYDDRTSLKQWGKNKEIQNRVSSIFEATSSVVLFLEYFPSTMTQYLTSQLSRFSDPISSLKQLENSMFKLLKFLRSNGVLHMDAHFDNILTDGKQIYLSDYGLSLSKKFKLSEIELKFFEQHHNFDCCTAINSLVHAVVNHYSPNQEWRQILRKIQNADTHTMKKFPKDILEFFENRSQISLLLGEFYDHLSKNLNTPYPVDRLQEHLNELCAESAN